MTYLFNANTSVINEVEIKNDANNALRVNVANNNANVTTANPFPVVIIGGNTSSQLVSFPKEATSAFGEMSVVENTPIVQIDAVYGFVNDSMIQLNLNGGTSEANAQTSMFMANSGTSVGGSGTIRSRRVMRYRPGQGAIARFTAMYTLGDAINKYGIDGATQRAGLSNIGNGYSFGFSGATANNKVRTFGIAHTYNGEAEIRKLTLTTAPTGTQTVTITLNGTAYTATVHSGNTSNASAEIANALSTSATDWYIDQNDGFIVFSYTTAGPKNGVYSISATGAGTLINGSFTQVNAGVAATNDWLYQEDWNGEPVPTLNPANLNVFQIDYRWLGAGIVRFLMEDPENSGTFKLLHTQHWVNDHAFPHVKNPSFRIGWASNVTGTPAVPAIIKGASAMAAIQGQLTPTSFSKSWYNNVSTNLGSGSLHHILSIRNPYMKAGKINVQELVFQDLTVSAQGNDPSIVHVFINGTLSSSVIYNAIPNSSALQSTQIGPTMDTSIDLPVCSFTVGVNGTSQFDLIPYRLTLSPGDYISIAIQSTSTLTRAAVGLNWSAD